MRLKKFGRASIITRIVLAGSVSLVLFAIAMLVFIKIDLQQAIYTETDARVQVAQNTMGELIRAKGVPTLVDGKLRLGRWVANDDNSLVDHLHALTGADATLFAILDGKPMRVTTTILKLNGSGRNVHTELVGPAREAFNAGRSFAGVSAVAGRPFLNRYDALRDARGRVIGIVYTGIPLTTMSNTVSQAMRTVLVVTAIALLASLLLLYIVMRPLQRAFQNAVTMARGLAGGDVDQHSESLRRSHKPIRGSATYCGRAVLRLLDYTIGAAPRASALDPRSPARVSTRPTGIGHFTIAVGRRRSIWLLARISQPHCPPRTGFQSRARGRSPFA